MQSATHLWSIVVVVIFAASSVACAEARPGNPGGIGGSGAAGGSGGQATTTTTETATGGQSTSTGQGGAAALPLVINEIGATGDEFVEIVNLSSDVVSLDGLALADTDTVNGGPKTADAARFPKDAEIQPGEHLVVLCGQAGSDGVGPHDKCGNIGPSTCYYATWSVSAKNGEKVYLLGQDDAVLSEVEYPADAAPSGDTWGRFPDVTGDFADTKSTPGDVNEQP